MQLGVHKTIEPSIDSIGNYQNNTVVVVASGLDTVTYNDMSNDMEAWDKYSQPYIGKVDNFGDWKCLRDTIKALVEGIAGVDYSTYANLTTAQKTIACKYVPTKIIDNIGFAQLVTDSGSVTQAKVNLDNYKVKSKEARTKRYGVLVNYVYQRMGKIYGLQAEDVVRANSLHGKYKERGILKKSEDTVDGFDDYLRANNGFTVDGLQARLNDATYTLINDGSGQTIQQFIDACAAIVETGTYTVN